MWKKRPNTVEEKTEYGGRKDRIRNNFKIIPHKYKYLYLLIIYINYTEKYKNYSILMWNNL